MKKQKTTSLVSGINAHFQWRGLMNGLGAVLAAGFAAFAAWCLALESGQGQLRIIQNRRFFFPADGSLFERVRNGFYYFKPAESEVVLTVPAGRVLSFLMIALPVLGAIVLLGWGIGWIKNERFLKEAIRPINEAAQEAQRIAESSINIRQIHNVEKAIDSITDSASSVDIGDDDMSGVETAINNLLGRLRESYAEQTRFVDDASHELRTPIAVIQGYSAMLERWGKDDPATLEEALQAIREESEHMQTLVDQLLFLARGDGGRTRLALRPLSPGAIMREVTEESRMIDKEHEYRFTDGGTAEVLADPAMLKQAVRILLDNAAKYTPAGGSITLVTSTQADGTVCLSVKDRGIGITQEEASRMFERFFRGDAVRGSTRGSGLGLSIAKWIVDRHNGVIRVLGYPDIGTMVSICLPPAGEGELPQETEI